MGPTKQTALLILIATALVMTGAYAYCQQGSAVGDDLNAIVARMEQTQEQGSSRTQPYSMVRDYRIFSDGAASASSEVLARVDFLPPDRKTFAILQASGSGRGESIVNHLLENEASLTKSGSSEISRRNYGFRLLRRELLAGNDCYVLELDPRRRDHGLISGAIWVDAQSYRIRRVEGDLVKTPSWWLKKTHVVRSYDDRGGLWLPVATEAVADVRLMGKHRLSEHEVSFNAGAVVAANRTPAPLIATMPRAPKRGGSVRPSVPAALGAGVPLR